MLAVFVAFAGSAALTWRKWPDLQVDFGLQLYAPWQIASGRVLYRDFVYLGGGPLSQYFNALLFSVFGVSFLVVVLANVAIAIVLLLLVHRRFLAASDAWTATLICLGIVLVFAFHHDAIVGNYNYIAPYAHESWHGLVLTIVSIALLAEWMARERIAWAAAAGLGTGLVFMTKPEVFAALAVAVVAAFVAVGVVTGGRGFVAKSVAAFVLAGLAPLLGFFSYFAALDDYRGALRSVAFAWIPLLQTSAARGVFYRWCLGLDAPAHHVTAMLAQFAIVVAMVGLCAFVLRRKLNSRVDRLLTVGFITAAGVLASRFEWGDCGRSLPLLSGALAVTILARYRGRALLAQPTAFTFLWAVFGLALLAKLGLFSRIWHYGFTLAMPAFASAIYLLHWQAPSLLERYGVQRRLFRLTVGVVLMVGFLQLFAQSQYIYREKTVTVGENGDAIVTQIENRPVNAIIHDVLPWITANVPRDATLTVLPEGAMVNYLSRRASPTRHLVWNPVELEAFGHEDMIADFQRAAPDYVLVLPRETSEFGVQPFGRRAEFGLDLLQWIRYHYRPVHRVGNGVDGDADVGIVWQRR